MMTVLLFVQDMVAHDVGGCGWHLPAEVLFGNFRLGEPAHPFVVGILEDQGVFVLFDLFLTQTSPVPESFEGGLLRDGLWRASP